MKKHLANIITCTRIICAIVLFFFRSVNGTFLVVYTFCGLTDLIDGPIARKMRSQSNIGAVLDTVGDVATYVALAKILLTEHLVPFWAMYWYISAAAGILCSGIIAVARFGRFFVMHSFCGKLMGGAAFLMPFALYSGMLTTCFVLICTTATISAIETAVITLKADDPEHTAISLIGFFCINRAKIKE